jgi:radical SAM protein with 4Fe4S-binding SPASM domain
VRELLLLQGGCPAGSRLVNIDELGRLHPCLYWKDYTFGSVREEKFSELWSGENEVLKKLRNRGKHLKGRCGRCAHAAICGGCRARAAQAFGDYLQSDPACYIHG